MFEQVTKFANEATDTVTDAINDSDISERFTTTSDQVLDAVLDANRRIVDAAVSTADRVGDQIKIELPFTDRLPTPAEAGERYLDFVERAVSLNRDMNQRVAEMITADNAKAASDKVVGTAKNVADTATKTVTKKAPAKKAAAKRPARKAAAKRPAKKTVAKKAAASK
jgi:CHASE3 domain sensor protein